MDFHRKEWEEKPVVMDKPRRGRDMVTTEVPTDLLDTMRTITAKQQLTGGTEVKNALESERAGGVELYHEGWVDGKKYLIPDSNLEIMKDLVNLKIRRKGDSIYVKEKDYKATRMDTEKQFQTKLRAMSEKINELEAAKLLKKKSIYKTSEPSTDRSVQESAGSSAVMRRRRFEIVPMSDDSTTFLISGHIRENSSPLFIIQKYKGKSPFGRRRSDFSQVKSTRNVDILISGNFFRRSVLEETHNKIEGIRLKWNLLVPVDERSKLYEKRFSQHFNVKGLDVLFEGDFIKQPGLLNYTPILTFLVPRPEQLRRGEGRGPHKSKSKPLYRSISGLFRRKNVTTYNIEVENKPIVGFMADDFSSGVDESSTEALSVSWSSAARFDGEDVTDGNRNDNDSYQIRLVMVSPRDEGRSVAGGSSAVRLPEDKTPSIAVAAEHVHNSGRVEEASVFYAVNDELWSPVCSVEPSIKSESSWWGRGSEESYGRERGDACHVNHRSRTCSNKSAGSVDTITAGTRQKNVHAAERTSSDRGDITEYKCQVRPSKKRSQGNGILGSISRMFFK